MKSQASDNRTIGCSAEEFSCASRDVRIVTVRLCGLPWYQVYVRGVLACEAPGEAGARMAARNYIRKLARV